VQYFRDYTASHSDTVIFLMKMLIPNNKFSCWNICGKINVYTNLLPDSIHEQLEYRCLLISSVLSFADCLVTLIESC
jgi:hypothetical protein